jgi:hypothetical protein
MHLQNKFMATNLNIEHRFLSALSSLLIRVVLFVGGLLWGSWYFGMNLIGWGTPGTDRYERYELYNRIAPAVLLLLVVGTRCVPHF